MTISPGYDVSTPSDEVSREGWSAFDLIDRLDSGDLDASELSSEEVALLQRYGFRIPASKARERKFSSRSEAARYAASIRWKDKKTATGVKDSGPSEEVIGGRTVSQWRDAFESARASGEAIDGLDDFIDGFDDLGQCMLWVSKNGERLGLRRESSDDRSGRPIYEVQIMTEAVRNRYRSRENREYQWMRKNELDRNAAFDRIEPFVSSAGPVVAVHADGARGLLTDGRLKSQFESGRSSGAYTPHNRAVWETAAMGIHPGVDPQKRPIYGFMAKDWTDLTNRNVSQYGAIRLELKSSVFSRTTLTDGDSLGSDALPIPLRSTDISPRRVSDAEGSFGGYTEAQIRGPVTISDVAVVHVPVMKAKEFGAITQQFLDAGLNIEFY